MHANMMFSKAIGAPEPLLDFLFCGFSLYFYRQTGAQHEELKGQSSEAKLFMPWET